MFLKVKDIDFSSVEHGNLIACRAILRFSEVASSGNLAEPQTSIPVKSSPVLKQSPIPHEIAGSYNCAAMLLCCLFISLQMFAVGQRKS